MDLNNPLAYILPSTIAEFSEVLGDACRADPRPDFGAVLARFSDSDLKIVAGLCQVFYDCRPYSDGMAFKALGLALCLETSIRSCAACPGFDPAILAEMRASRDVSIWAITAEICRVIESAAEETRH